MAEPITGKDGKVRYGATPTEVAHVKNFSLTQTCEGKPYVESGITKRLAGNADWSGSFSAHADAGSLAAPFAVGDSVDLDLMSYAGQVCEGNALITEISAEVDVAGAEITGWQCSFEANGALTIT